MKEKVVFIRRAKGGLGSFHHLEIPVALENKDAGLTANIVLPGIMDTPANRKPRDVVNLVLSLTADRASQNTGTAIPIGGPNV